MNKEIATIALVAALGVTALSVGLVKNNVFASTLDNKTKIEASKEQNNDLNLTNIKAKLTKDDATQLALNKYKSSTIQNVKLENEDGNLSYEVDVVANGIKHEMKIDANNGNILTDKVDDRDSTESSKEADEDKEEASLKQQAKITPDQVKTIIGDKYKDGVITEVELENENGNIVYKVEVNVKDGVHDINVDASNGNILTDEIDH